MYFLTEIDPNARVKGTRDALGIQAVWTRFARQIVGGITSQTTSLNDFRILVFGSWLIDQLEDGSVPDSAAFACWEQLAAYSRLHIANDLGFRGITRAQWRLANQESIPISPSAQILTNQATYGIWGLYRSTAWSTGLLSTHKPYVSHPEVESVVLSDYVPKLEVGWGVGLKDLRGFLTGSESIRPKIRVDQRRMEAIASAMAGPLTGGERSLYRRFVVDGGPDGQGTNAPDVRRRQRVLYRALMDLNPTNGIQAGDIAAVAAASNDTDLANVLEDILAGAALLSAASRVFSYISQCDKSTVEKEVESLETHFATLPHLIASEDLRRLESMSTTNPKLLAAPGDKQNQEGRWLGIAKALHSKNWLGLIELVLEQNLVVSQAKGSGAGWVTVGDAGTIKVSLPDNGAALSGWSRVDDPWLEPYYVANLLRLAREIGAA